MGRTLEHPQLLTAFIFLAALYALIVIITDLFRDRELNGWAKAIWLIFLVILPFLTALVYLIVRGGGMGARAAAAGQKAQQETEDYIRTVAGTSPSEEISKAKELLDHGTITPEEFETIKQRALQDR